MKESKQSEEGAGPSRKRLVFEWWLAVTASFLVALAIRLLFFEPIAAEPDFEFLGVYVGMVLVSFVGWLIYGVILGPSWGALLSLILLLRFRKRRFLVLGVLAAVVLAVLWPKLFWMMMSV